MTPKDTVQLVKYSRRSRQQNMIKIQTYHHGEDTGYSEVTDDKEHYSE